ncbi:MAG: TPM domain-containing protein [Lachnospiraceae bacterium]
MMKTHGQRKRLLFFLCIGWICFAGLRVKAAGAQVTDQADLLSDAEETALEERITEMEEVTGWDIMAVTTEDTEGKSSRSYAEDWYEANLVSEDGVICLIDMEHRMLYIATFGQAIDYLTDSRIDTILNDAYDGASTGDYSDSFEEMLEGIERFFKRGIPDNQYRYDTDTGTVVSRHRGITAAEMIIAAVLAIAAGTGTVAAIYGSYKMKWGIYRYSGRENGKLSLTEEKDIMTGSFVTHRRIPRNDSHGGGPGVGGSRSSVHHTSGGRSSGGGGRGF